VNPSRCRLELGGTPQNGFPSQFTPGEGETGTILFNATDMNQSNYDKVSRGDAKVARLQ